MSTTATPAKTLPMASAKKSGSKRSTRKTTTSKTAVVTLVKPPVSKLRKASKPEGFELGFQIARKDGQPVLPKGKGGVRFESAELGEDGRPEMVVWVPQKRWAKMGKPEIIGGAFSPPSA